MVTSKPATSKPDWLRVKAPQRERIGAVADLLLDLTGASGVRPALGVDPVSSVFA